MSLQGDILLFAVGVVESMIFAGVILLTGFAVFIPLGIICLNVISVFIFTIIKHHELIKATTPQLINFFNNIIQAMSVI
jgi:hypothetical protein